MHKQQPSEPASSGPGNALPEAEASLGQALALIHRALARLDEPGRAGEVQSALQKTAGLVESARQAHQRLFAAGSAAVAGVVQTGLDSELVAVISAAVTAVLDRPYRLVSVEPVVASVPHLNVWALEGRTQIFQSHKIR
ncbi:MAG TPA: hypothetical protein VFE51_04470 [Verrucomicrobiae bacterium]|nr:hypothetical protein [Verrucomicrobiae bacterium]